jgi:hypothetical protein
MMMNIRGLIFDDPRGTEGIEFSTIEFQAPRLTHVFGHAENEDDDDTETLEIGPESHIGCASHV